MRSILVVEDDHTMRAALSDLLTLGQPGLNMIEAENGQDGVMLAVKERPDLILLDASMPVMNGYQAAQALRQMPKTKSIPLIAITGEPVDSPLVIGLRTVCDACLHKPFSMDELMRAIEQINENNDHPNMAGEPESRCG